MNSKAVGVLAIVMTILIAAAVFIVAAEESMADWAAIAAIVGALE